MQNGRFPSKSAAGLNKHRWKWNQHRCKK